MIVQLKRKFFIKFIKYLLNLYQSHMNNHLKNLIDLNSLHYNMIFQKVRLNLILKLFFLELKI